jgi:hypothetical protein
VTVTNPPDVLFLETAVKRIQELLEALGASMTPKIERVVLTADERLTPPYWWLYPGVPEESTLSSDYRRQTYAVIARLVLGGVTSGYDRALAERLWIIIPQVVTYLVQRRHLIADVDQTSPRGLDMNGVRIEQITPFGVFTESGDVGVELQITLPFEVSTSLVYP